MKKFKFIFSLLLICNTLIYSQLTKIYVLNEGSFDFISGQIVEPVSVGVFDIQAETYVKLVEIPNARFASDMIMDGNSLWVAADRYLVELDLITMAIKRSHEIEGLRKISIYGDKIIVTRGEYQKVLDSYVQIWDKENLKVIFEIPQADMEYTTENIVVKNQMAYIAVNNGFVFGAEVGKILTIDLDQLQWTGTIEMGDEAKNPENLMLYGDLLLALNNKDFTGSSVSVIDLNTSKLQVHNLSDVQSLCGTSVLEKDGILYQEFGESTIGKFDIAGSTSGFYKELNESFYGMNFNPAYQILCAGVTDFSSFGKVLVYDKNYNLVYDFQTGIAPAYFIFQGDPLQAVDEISENEILVYPNPTTSSFAILSPHKVTRVSVLDIFGHILFTNHPSDLDFKNFPPGTFTLKIELEEKVVYKRVTKL
ncbi:MAG: T9SS type A sorting domain-containing protein [Saprospiraceae bacterium]|nr:T9SS type A sorting domain-containing protein [Saprospiraceae bacterium]